MLGVELLESREVLSATVTGISVGTLESRSQ